MGRKEIRKKYYAKYIPLVSMFTWMAPLSMDWSTPYTKSLVISVFYISLKNNIHTSKSTVPKLYRNKFSEHIFVWTSLLQATDAEFRHKVDKPLAAREELVERPLAGDPGGGEAVPHGPDQGLQLLSAEHDNPKEEKIKRKPQRRTMWCPAN